jgi:phosphoserine phosphatase SerB
MENNYNSSNKMVIFDMDDTLLHGRFIDKCAEKFNFTQALALLRQIDHKPVSLTQRIASFLKDKHKDELIKIASEIELVEDIVHVITELKKRSYIVGIISDSYQLITNYIGEKINADFGLSNQLQYEGDYLTGEVLIPSYFHYSDESSCRHQVCKTNALRYACAKYNVKMENSIVVGDSENDICIIQHAGTGVAFCTTNEVLKNVAGRQIDERAFADLLSYAS